MLLVNQFNHSTDLLVAKLHQIYKTCQSKEDCILNIYDYMGRLTMDVIAKVAFGLDLNSVEDDETPFAKAVYATLLGFSQGQRDPLLRWKPWRKKDVHNVHNAIDMLRKVGREAIQARLDLMMSSKQSGSDSHIPDDVLSYIIGLNEKFPSVYDVEEQLDDFCTIFIAGQETTANALTWALKELGRNPEWKSSLVEEAEAILGSKDFVEMEDLNKLKETEKVMKEVLRLYPPVQLIARISAEKIQDFGEGKHVLPKDTDLMISVFGTHRHPDLWENPDGFDPSRWDRVSPSQDRFAFIPFSGGSRNCIGQVFAQFEAKIILSRFLRNFDFELVPPVLEGHHAFVELLTLKPAEGLKILLKAKD